MKPSLPSLALLSAAASLSASRAEDIAFPPAVPFPDAWEDWNDWGIGGVLFPNIHMHGVGGFSGDDPGVWQGGGHDPKRRTFSAQAIEPGASLKTKYVEGFANYLWFQDAAGDWDGEWEEAFLRLTNLPGGLSARGGRFLPRQGAQNDRHLHAWDFVDAEMTSARFLGEEGLLLEGGDIELTLPLQDLSWTGVFTLGFGQSGVAGHDHGGGAGGGEDDHDDHDGDDEDHDDHGDDDDHDDHDDHGAGALFEAEEAVLQDDIATARALVRYQPTDFHSFTGGASWAGGKNGYGRDTHVAGFDFEYLWRERGLEPGGKAFRWRNEYLWRDIDAREVIGGVVTSGSFQESGFYTHLIGTWNQRLDTGLRLSWMEGISELGLDERFRISPAVTWYLDDSRRMSLRLQTNHDWIAGGGTNNAVWLQFSMSLGSTEEVR
jgi:hypothetical protein